jgi:hypothetical protein
MRPLDDGGFQLPPLNGNLYYTAFQCVSTSNDQGPPELLEALEQLRELIPDFPVPNSGNKSQIMSHLARQAGSNLENHVAANFEQVLNRLILFELPGDWTQDVRTKIANHVFKRVAGRETYWPYSVPQTPDREAEADAAEALMLLRGYHFQRDEDQVLGDYLIREKFRLDPNPFLRMFHALMERLEVPDVHRDPDAQPYVSSGYLKRKLRKLRAFVNFSPGFKNRLAANLKRLVYGVSNTLRAQNRVAGPDEGFDAEVYLLGIEVGNGTFLNHYGANLINICRRHWTRICHGN